MSHRALSEWLAWQEQLHPSVIDLGLERVAEVWKRLHPGPYKPFVFTVAGTNGKGSCVAYLDAILRHAGYRTGSYTSPHLVRYNERIRVDGETVNDEAICAAFERIDTWRESVSLTYFEFGTLAALDIFARQGVDVAILEVGLGGRLDAVNLLDADAVLVASGTATLECLLLGRPMIVAYRLHPLSYPLVKHMLKVPFVSLPNLLLGTSRLSVDRARSDELAPPWPDLVIAASRRAAPVARSRARHPRLVRRVAGRVGVVAGPHHRATVHR